jgi:uncharacterized protein YndB with AHSA1/START domain
VSTTRPPAATSTNTSSSDKIEEQVLLHAPRARVWRALTTPDEFAAWFGVKLRQATIAPGAQLLGNMAFPGYEHVGFDAIVDEVVPERKFSWRWHPHAMEKGADYSSEPRTLVTFTLEDAPGGDTLVRVVETGFDAIPAARRSAAFLGNSNRWKGQLQKRLPAFLAGA